MPAPRQSLLTDFYCSPRMDPEPGPAQDAKGESGPALSLNCDPISVADRISVDENVCESPSPTDNYPSSSSLAGSSAKVVRTVVLSGKENRKRRRTPLDDPKQMILDAGQRLIGHQHCRMCGMVYDCDSLSDRREHKKFHSRFQSTEWFRVQTSQLDVWKRSTFCIVQQYGGNYCYIFCINQTSKCTLKVRLEKVILECVNKVLGYAPDLAEVWTSDGRRQAWVCITALDSYYFIGGIALVEKVLEEQLYSSEENDVISRDGDTYMGVNRIWVHKNLQGQGIASLLLDNARKHFIGSKVIPRECIAFSSPTENGLTFAKRFVPEGKVLLYSLRADACR